MAHSFLCVLSSDPQIVTMELDYVAGFSETSSSPQQLRTLRAGGGGTLLSLSL